MLQGNLKNEQIFIKKKNKYDIIRFFYSTITIMWVGKLEGKRKKCQGAMRFLTINLRNDKN